MQIQKLTTQLLKMRGLRSPIFLFRLIFGFAVFIFIVSIISNISIVPQPNAKTLETIQNPRNIQKASIIKTPHSHRQTVLIEDGIPATNFSYFNTNFSSLSSICEGEDASRCSTPFRRHTSQIYVCMLRIWIRDCNESFRLSPDINLPHARSPKICLQCCAGWCVISWIRRNSGSGIADSQYMNSFPCLFKNFKSKATSSCFQMR